MSVASLADSDAGAPRRACRVVSAAPAVAAVADAAAAAAAVSLALFRVLGERDVTGEFVCAV